MALTLRTLPGEIRNMIFREVLSPTGFVTLQIVEPDVKPLKLRILTFIEEKAKPSTTTRLSHLTPPTLIKDSEIEQIHLSLLKTCKQFYHECRTLLWDLNTFIYTPAPMMEQFLSLLICCNDGKPEDRDEQRTVTRSLPMPFSKIQHLQFNFDLFHKYTYSASSGYPAHISGATGNLFVGLSHWLQRLDHTTLTKVKTLTINAVEHGAREEQTRRTQQNTYYLLHFLDHSRASFLPKGRNGQNPIDNTCVQRNFILTSGMRNKILEYMEGDFDLEKLLKRIHNIFKGKMFVDETLCWEDMVKIADIPAEKAETVVTAVSDEGPQA